MKTKMVAAMSRHEISSLALGVVAALALATLAFVPVPAAAQSCDQLFAKYEGSSWWWGAFGNCKKPGGTVDRNAIFECAWSQVPAPENTACLKGKLLSSASTKNGIDVVVAYNSPPASAPAPTCDQLFAKYEGSSWWWGAFGNCKKPGGTVDRNAIFECAWSQVPAPENTACLKGKLLSSASTKNGIDVVVAYNSPPASTPANSVARNRFTVDPPAERCSPTGSPAVPPGYFPIPKTMVDAPAAEGRFQLPSTQNLGWNEGRLNAALRQAARDADPIKSLAAATREHALGNSALGNAFADLSVTGRRSFAQFRRAPPTEAQVLSWLQAYPDRRLARVPPDALKSAYSTAIVRAFAVANILRVSNIVQTPKGKASSPERQKLGWIAVSGEDDQPYRPVNVPTSKYPMHEMTVTVRGTPVATRFVIADAGGPFAPTRPADGRQVSKDPAPVLAPDADVLLFIHGMDSRAEEAEDQADALRKLRPGKHLTIISMDLPTSGYATNLDHCSIGRANRGGQFCDALFELGDPKEPPQWFDAHGRHNVPVLDFIEEFIVQFVNTLDEKLRGQLKPRVKAIMGGSLGGNMSLRLSRRPDLPWVRNIVAWSPASIWESLADGSVVSPLDIVTVGTRHGGVRAGWQDAGGNAIQLTETDGQRANFFNAAFDKSILAGIVSPAQAQMWMSDRWPCKQPALVGARLDRHETYDRNFRLWHWRLGTEQLIFSHAARQPGTGRMLVTLSTKNTLLACGHDDDFPYTNICSATQFVAAFMTTTPGRALFLRNTGHSIDTEHPVFFAQQVVDFLGL